MQQLSGSDNKQTYVRPDSSGFIWIIQIVTGALLILLLGLHMIAHHFIVEGGLRPFTDVIAYVSNPVIFVLEILFLLVVTPHAVFGLQNVILDLGFSEANEQRIRWIFYVILVITLVYGIWLAVALQGQ
mgnify:CR=1 FL=1